MKRTLVHGEDALQALCLALDFVGNTLYSRRRRGLRLIFPTGHSVRLHAYFRLREMRRRLEALATARGHRRSKRPPNRPLERTGMKPSRASKRLSAGRSAPIRSPHWWSADGALSASVILMAQVAAREEPMASGSAKQKVLEVIEKLPPDATVEDAIERLVLLAKTERGLAQLDAGQGVDHAEAKRRLLR